MPVEFGRPPAVWYFFIGAHQQFTAQNVRAGRYEVHYHDLEVGGCSKSEPFTLREERTDDGVRYSEMTMTLHKVRNGNMPTYPLSDDEF